jgi:cation diffusion facilitator CzcD-associated flavoprotein CzcO
MTAQRNGMKSTYELEIENHSQTVRKLKIKMVETDEIFEDDADVLIAARGTLNDIAWPQIPGLRSFKGEIMHLAAWNEK